MGTLQHDNGTRSVSETGADRFETFEVIVGRISEEIGAVREIE